MQSGHGVLLCWGSFRTQSRVHLHPLPPGFSTQTWDALASQFSASLASLVRVPANCISIARTADVAIVSAAGQRRLLAQR